MEDDEDHNSEGLDYMQFLDDEGNPIAQTSVYTKSYIIPAGRVVSYLDLYSAIDFIPSPRGEKGAEVASMAPAVNTNQIIFFIVMPPYLFLFSFD